MLQPFDRHRESHRMAATFGPRGFLAGVVRKRLKLTLASKKVNGNRIYQITSGDSAKVSTRPAA